MQGLVGSDATGRRNAGTEHLGQRAPILIVPRVKMFQEAAEVGRLAAIKIVIEFRLVAVASVRISPECAERDQRVEEIVGATFMNSGTACQGLEVKRIVGKRCNTSSSTALIKAFDRQNA